MDNVTIFIEDGELIVGNTASKPQGFEIIPLRGQWVSPDKEVGVQKGEEFFFHLQEGGGEGSNFVITDKELDEIRDVSQYWQNRIHHDQLRYLLDGKYWDITDAVVLRVGTFSGRNMVSVPPPPSFTPLHIAFIARAVCPSGSLLPDSTSTCMCPSLYATGR